LTQVVGTFLQTNTQLDKRTQISDGIRSEVKTIDSKTREYSQGSIQQFDLLSSEARDGLIRVQARVTVRLDDFRVPEAC
jgi:hypothetical protein